MIKNKLIFCLSILIIMTFSLTGCQKFTTDTAELITPPMLSGDVYVISEALKESTGGNYTLKYPSKGNYRSAVVQNDIDNDGVLEAFAFYSTVDGDVTTMHINAICNKNGKWKSVDDQKIVAGGVDQVEFCDLDNDGIQEILVGWEIYGTSDMELAVYSFTNDSLKQRTIQKYTNFVSCDLNEDSKNEILIINCNVSEQINFASLYNITDDGVTSVATCQLDSKVKSIREVFVSTLSSGKPAVYIDEVKGAGAITEVLFYEKSALVNPLLDQDSLETTQTLRSSSYSAKDINNDGVTEIPIQREINSVGKNDSKEKLFIINWCSFNGETLTNQMSTLINLNDGYYFILNQKLANGMAVLKNTDDKVREIYEYDNKNNSIGEKLIYFKVVEKKEWDKGKYSGLGFEEIINNGDYSYICSISEIAKNQGFTLENIQKNFKLLE